MVFAVKFDPLGQIKPNFEFSKQNKFLTSGEKDISMLHHLGWKKRQKHGENLTPNDLYHKLKFIDFGIYMKNFNQVKKPG